MGPPITPVLGLAAFARDCAEDLDPTGLALLEVQVATVAL
jgi:hypothetical protein